MSILSAQTIRRRCGAPDPFRELEHGYTVPTVLRPLIRPFFERSVFEGMSFGLSCHGYDVRVDQDIHLTGGGFTLASTIEEFDMPIDLCAMVKDKSSWARQGICVQNTIIEAGWRGHLTLEVTMHALGHVHIPRGAPIAQIVFQLLDEPTDQPYGGRYQDQEAGPQEARLITEEMKNAGRF